VRGGRARRVPSHPTIQTLNDENSAGPFSTPRRSATSKHTHFLRVTFEQSRRELRDRRREFQDISQVIAEGAISFVNLSSVASSVSGFAVISFHREVSGGSLQTKALCRGL